MFHVEPTLMAYTAVVCAASLLIGLLVCVGGKSAQETGTNKKDDNEK